MSIRTIIAKLCLTLLSVGTVYIKALNIYGFNYCVVTVVLSIAHNAKTVYYLQTSASLRRHEDM
jgi:ABC-type transport system involved in Fe-S cluster assembly fused permease/ATPase subunit